MGKTSFLINEDIWETIPEMIKTSKRTDVAVAFLGTEGSKLLPLKRGDRLIVDMSPAIVKSGATNPFEVEKLIKRGVKVFTRRNLHAKVICTEKSVLVGSANVSKNSRDILDEAAIFTTDPLSIQRSKDFIEQICIEPVLPKYLNECKKLYRPPRITRNQSNQNDNKKRRVVHAKLWILSLHEGSIPESEQTAFDKSEKKAEKLIKNQATSILENWHSTRPNKVEVGDWVIQCLEFDDKNIDVYSPSRLIFIDEYIRNGKTGAKRYVYHLEAPSNGQEMEWKQFRRVYKSITKKKLEKPRTIGIKDTKIADDLFRLWTPKGRISKRK